MAGSKTDTNFHNVTFRAHFSQKPTIEAISDLSKNKPFKHVNLKSDSSLGLITDLSENLKHHKDTNHSSKTDQNIYSSQTEENAEESSDSKREAIDEDEPQDEISSLGEIDRSLIKSLAGIVCVVIAALIAFVVMLYIYPSKADPSVKKIIEEKCKEYTDLACSLQSSNIKNSSPIIHGENVLVGKLPHQVFVTFESAKSNETVDCGGSLINEKFVLTAAQCIINVKFNTGKVILGSIDAMDTMFHRKVITAHQHPDYSNRQFKSDLCLLELNENVNFTSNVRPLCLNTKFPNHYDNMILAGWGKPGNINDPTRLLKIAKLHIDDKIIESCRNTLRGMYSQVERIGICAADSTQGGEIGDYGGPLVVELKSKCKNTWEQIGVFTRTEGNYTDQKLVLQLFMRVEYYIPWIVSVVWPDSQPEG